LSVNLSLPSTIAQRMLFAFVKEKGDSVAATYLISGMLKSTGLHDFQLVGKAKVDDTVRLFDPVLSLHIFSVEATFSMDPVQYFMPFKLQLLDIPETQLPQQLNKWSTILHSTETHKVTPSSLAPQPPQQKKDVLKEKDINSMTNKPEKKVELKLKEEKKSEKKAPLVDKLDKIAEKSEKKDQQKKGTMGAFFKTVTKDEHIQ